MRLRPLLTFSDVTARDGWMLFTHTCFERTALLFSISKQSAAPLLGAPVCLNPHAWPLLPNHDISRKHVCFMGYVSLSTACTSWSGMMEGTEAIAIKAEHVALWAPGLSCLGKTERTNWLSTSWQKDEKGAEQTLLCLEENMDIHSTGRARTGQRKVSPRPRGSHLTCVDWGQKYPSTTFWNTCPDEAGCSWSHGPFHSCNQKCT